jgi:ParB family chromosome partitioning protein
MNGPDGYQLIAGLHRLEAVRKLGRATIQAGVVKGLDADQALLDEIDENLIRAELSPAERALHLSIRKRLYEKLYPETRHGGDRRPGRSSSQIENLKAFVQDTAEKTGKGRSTIARDVPHFP